MAHLTCELHKKRALVINGDPGLNSSRIIHREDGSRCGDLYNDFVKYRGHTLTALSILGGQIPKTQALTRKQRLELNERAIKDFHSTTPASEVIKAKFYFMR
jgi:hypothetical protein